MSRHLYQVDAFTTRLFGGNPAAVVPLSEWLPDLVMCAISAENNLSETAFFVPAIDNGADFHLRWFTPTVEVDLCGHATLASDSPSCGRALCVHYCTVTVCTGRSIDRAGR